MPRLYLALVFAVFVSFSLSAGGPQIVVTDAPNGMGQEGGGALASDSLTVLNVGPGTANVSIGQKGNFFSVSPNSFTLAEGQSRVVTIRSTTQANGVSDGSIDIFSSTSAPVISIPIRLFVGGRPAGIVTPIPGPAVTVSGLLNQSHSGQISVQNRGNVGMQGILVPDSRWIAPQSGVVGIPANGTSPGPFVVDPSKRPDGDAPLGVVSGRLALVYLNGTANTTSSESTISAAPASSRVTVTVFDISKPPVAPGQPGPLDPNEIAVFLAGLTNLSGVSTDVFISNRAATSIPNVKLFYTPANTAPSSALLANVQTLGANINAWFPSVQSLLFNVSNQKGTLQLRNSAVLNVSLTAIQSVAADPINTYQTALPVMRSDRGSSTRTFSGVDKSASRRTNITLQETSGNATTVTLDFFDANGTNVGAPTTQSLQPFGLVALEDVVPAGAVSARATAGGAGKIDGYATLVDGFTLDSWVIYDPRASSADDVFIAAMPAVASASVDVFVTGPASVTVVGKDRRRHSARVHAAGGEATISAAANATQRSTFSSSTPGYIRISGASGAFTGSARVSLNRPGFLGFFGSAIPLRRASDGAATGTSRRMNGIDDPLSGPHPALTLIETGGGPANVQVLARFTFSAGNSANTQVTAGKDFVLAPGEMLTIEDVVGTVIGAGRPTFGDLKRVFIDVNVTGGAGRVLPFVRTTDKVSGDVTILSD